MRNLKLPTLIGVALLVVGLIAGVYLIQQTQVFRLGAEISSAPKNVRITNITEDSFSVSWTTDDETTSFVKWGTSASRLDNTELDEIGEDGFVHYLTVNGLEENSPYFFSIVSGGEDFDNNGTAWELTTGSALPSPTNSLVISGTVLEPSGTPAGGVIVYATVGGSSSLSTVTSSGGSWIIPISTLRSQNRSSYVQIDPENDVVEISVQGATQVASAQALVASANPLPAMTLGEVYDFQNLAPTRTTDLPSADLSVPSASRSSGFNVEGGEIQEGDDVTIDSIDAGEVVTSTIPQFFGRAPATTEITITVKSTPQTATITSSSVGNWSWNPPENLEPGPHTITVSWRDLNGVLNTITRNFIVQAAEGPAFEATPSATPTNSPTPSASPTASPTPSPTPSLTPSASPSAKPTSTPAPLPESGTLTPTLILISMGLGLLLFGTIAGSFAYKRNER